MYIHKSRIHWIVFALKSPLDFIYTKTILDTPINQIYAAKLLPNKHIQRVKQNQIASLRDFCTEWKAGGDPVSRRKNQIAQTKTIFFFVKGEFYLPVFSRTLKCDSFQVDHCYSEWIYWATPINNNLTTNTTRVLDWMVRIVCASEI